MSTALARPARSSKPIRVSERGNFLTGCLVVLGIILVLAIAGGVFVYMNWKTWAADASVAIVDAAFDEAGIPPDQKAKMMVEVEQLAADFKSGDMTVQEFGEVATSLAESPFFKVAGASLAHRQYIEPKGLSEEEKAEGKLQLGRLARGYQEGSISDEELQSALSEIVVKTVGDGQFELRDPESVTDDDARQLIQDAKTAADAAEVPSEPYEIDLADEFKKAIDKARGRNVETETTPPTGGESAHPAGDGQGDNGTGGEGG